MASTKSTFAKSNISSYFLNGGKEGLHVLKTTDKFELTPYEIGGESHNFVTIQGLDANRLVGLGLVSRESTDDTISFAVIKDCKVMVKLKDTITVTPTKGEPYQKKVWEYKEVQ